MRLKIGIGLFVLVLAVIGYVLANYDTIPFWERSEYISAETTVQGVVVHGCNVRGWIRNDNPIPMRIRSTWVARGEADRWTKILQPGEQIPENTNWQISYHLYLLDDSQEIGLLWCEPNGPKGPQYRNAFTGKLH